MYKEEHHSDDQLQIELSEEVAQGVYSNLAIITHSPSEFILDFVAMLPGISKAKVRSRIIMAPEHAYRLYRALQDNIRKYESQYGEIVAPATAESEPGDTIPFPLSKMSGKGDA